MNSGLQVLTGAPGTGKSAILTPSRPGWGLSFSGVLLYIRPNVERTA